VPDLLRATLTLTFVLLVLKRHHKLYLPWDICSANFICLC